MLHLLEMLSRKCYKMVGNAFVYGAMALTIFYSLKWKSYSPYLIHTPSFPVLHFYYSRSTILVQFWSSYRLQSHPQQLYYYVPVSRRWTSETSRRKVHPDLLFWRCRWSMYQAPIWSRIHHPSYHWWIYQWRYYRHQMRLKPIHSFSVHRCFHGKLRFYSGEAKLWHLTYLFVK